MFLYPTKTLNAVCIILAVMLFALGIRYLIEYRKKNLINDFYRYEFVAGIALILLGIVVLACMNLILSIITYVIALIIIVSGLMKIENALDLRRMGCHWIPLLVFAIICIILGISVLTMPMNHNDDGTRTAGDFLIQCSMDLEWTTLKSVGLFLYEGRLNYRRKLSGKIIGENC